MSLNVNGSIGFGRVTPSMIRKASTKVLENGEVVLTKKGERFIKRGIWQIHVSPNKRRASAINDAIVEVFTRTSYLTNEARKHEDSYRQMKLGSVKINLKSEESNPFVQDSDAAKQTSAALEQWEIDRIKQRATEEGQKRAKCIAHSDMSDIYMNYERKPSGSGNIPDAPRRALFIYKLDHSKRD